MSDTTAGGRIIELSERIKNQIAAGEVVERPASVVKELVENALDAGATEVRVDLEEGGVRLVRVVDDGSGIAPEDLELSFRSHATSKLRELADLDHIASLGFRGEALASIGSVARARILSRAAGASVGCEVEDEGGHISEVREAGGAHGTTVEVRDLFFNTPARRRFLKRTSTELARALDVLQRLALAHVGVGFVVTHDRARVFDVEASMDLLGRVRRLFGAELADSLVPVEGRSGTTRLAGYVAPPRFSRRDTSRQMWFLNGRPLRDRILIRVLKQAYHGFLVEGRQPVGFLNLAMDPGQVDVNVHPTKSEVRFREERSLFGFLVTHLRSAVASTDMSTPGDKLLGSLERRGEWAPAGAGAGDVLTPHLPDPGAIAGRAGELSVRDVPGPAWEPPPGEAGAPAPRPAEAEAGASGWRARDELRGPFLQIDKTYLVRALPDGFEIVDQHALHERLTYEELRRQYNASGVEVQRLLVPELVELSPADMELAREHGAALARVGILVEVFGPRTVAVQGVPAALRRPDTQGLVRDALEVFAGKGRAPEADEVVEEVLHSAACRSSIMAGDELSESEIRSLLERAARLESDQTCPHARPTRVRFGLADLEKAFHRR